MLTVYNKDEIERRIIKHNKEHFSNVKDTKAHNKKHMMWWKKITREKMLWKENWIEKNLIMKKWSIFNVVENTERINAW